ncbi:hypothetical protein [Streptomyces blastmyceticus]
MHLAMIPLSLPASQHIPGRIQITAAARTSGQQLKIGYGADASANPWTFTAA